MYIVVPCNDETLCAPVARRFPDAPIRRIELKGIAGAVHESPARAIPMSDRHAVGWGILEALAGMIEFVPCRLRYCG